MRLVFGADTISLALLFPRMLASCNPVGAIRKTDAVAMCSSEIPEYLDAFPSDFLDVVHATIFSVLFDILNLFILCRFAI
jgi:hypothetical protein